MACLTVSAGVLKNEKSLAVAVTVAAMEVCPATAASSGTHVPDAAGVYVTFAASRFAKVSFCVNTTYAKAPFARLMFEELAGFSGVVPVSVTLMFLSATLPVFCTCTVNETGASTEAEIEGAGKTAEREEGCVMDVVLPLPLLLDRLTHAEEIGWRAASRAVQLLSWIPFS